MIGGSRTVTNWYFIGCNSRVKLTARSVVNSLRGKDLAAKGERTDNGGGNSRAKQVQVI